MFSGLAAQHAPDLSGYPASKAAEPSIFVWRHECNRCERSRVRKKFGGRYAPVRGRHFSASVNSGSNVLGDTHHTHADAIESIMRIGVVAVRRARAARIADPRPAAQHAPDIATQADFRGLIVLIEAPLPNIPREIFDPL